MYLKNIAIGTLLTLIHNNYNFLQYVLLNFDTYYKTFNITDRGVIWGGWGAVAPKETEKKEKRKKKRKKRKKERKKKERKKGTMNNVKLLHITCCFFSNFSIVRWYWKIIKKFGPPRKSWNYAPDNRLTVTHYMTYVTNLQYIYNIHLLQRYNIYDMYCRVTSITEL